MTKQIKIIVTHPRPHLDEIAAIWLFKKFGESLFPGIRYAEIQYWGEEKIKKYPLEECAKQGILLVGIGGGRFDEHPTIENGRRENECAATLTARILGLDEDPLLERILEFTRKTDLKSAPHPFDLAFLVNLRNKQHPDKPEEVIDWTIKALQDFYNQQKEFFGTTKEEFEKKAQIEEIQVGNKNLKLVTIISDNEQIAKFARSKHGCEAAMVIQKNSRGNIGIFTARRFYLDILDLVVMIRIEEQRAKGRFVTGDYAYFSREGTMKEAEEWFYHEGIQALLNGSLTKSDVPPTRIPLEEIKELVKIAMNKNLFYCRHDPKKCRNCRWNKWGLHRCRKLRYQTFHSNS